MGHMSPPDPSASSSANKVGTSIETRPSGPFLRVRIGGLERNRKDLLIRFDASVGHQSGVFLSSSQADFRRQIFRISGHRCTGTCSGHMPNFSALQNRLSSLHHKVLSPFLALYLALTTKSAIIPALPLASTSAVTDEEGQTH
jgi:hypothetical protein